MANITYAQNSCLVKSPPFITIGNNTYHYVKVGNLYWTVEFLKENSTIDYYPDVERNGIRYYNYYYTANKNKLDVVLDSAYQDGFRIPTQADFDDLNSHFVGGFDGAEEKKFRSTEWENGTNEYGTNFINTGLHTGNGGTNYVDTGLIYLLKNTGAAVVYPRGGANWSEAGYSGGDLNAPIRLCKTV